MSFVEPFDEPSPFRRALNATEAASSVIAARWRAIVLLFIVVVVIWLVLQAFFAVRDAYVSVRDTYGSVRENVSKLNELSSQVGPKFSLSPPPVTNCWRDRSLAAGECFKSVGAARSPPERPRPPPHRPRFPECRRCDDI